MNATRNPEKAVAKLLRQGNVVYVYRHPEGVVVAKAFRQLPEWLTQRGGIFAWDESPVELYEWMFERPFDCSGNS
jgi:hypothetical protein